MKEKLASKKGKKTNIVVNKSNNTKDETRN